MNKTFTNRAGHQLSFDIIIDDLFLNLDFTEDIDRDKKALLSLINGFEDGIWMIKAFHSFIWNNIKETALSHQERLAMIDEESSLLEKSARMLRLLDEDKDNDGGEIGEILLYGIMKKYYGALPVVPKIFYKQNTNDYAKGADSVHIVLDNDADYSLWLGESKFYNNLDAGRLDKIVASVNGLLNTDKLKKEFSIVTSLKDLDSHIENESLRAKIKDDLKDGVSIDLIKKRLHVPILLLHECTVTASANSINDRYKDDLIRTHLSVAQKYMNKQDTVLSKSIYCYGDISFHLILFPVPAKKGIVEAFLNRAKLLKD
jgi:hypothetical protein